MKLFLIVFLGFNSLNFSYAQEKKETKPKKVEQVRKKADYSFYCPAELKQCGQRCIPESAKCPKNLFKGKE